MIARYVIARLLETFFSRWWLYLLPLVTMVGLGIYTAGSKTDTYRSAAVLSANDPLVDLRDSRSDTQWWETPAEVAARQINEALRTDAFVTPVASAAGVPTDTGVLTIQDVRQSVWAAANGQNLLTVNASAIDPQLAQNLVRSTIDHYLATVITQQISTGNATLEFYEGQLEGLQRQYDEALGELESYISAQPNATVDNDFEVRQLTRAVESADARLNSTLDSIQAAELVVEQATSDAAQTVREIDPPTFPAAPETGLRSLVMTVGTFAVLGVLLLVGGVVAGSFLDRSLRFAEEVRASLGVEVLAVVPVERRERGRRRRGAMA